MRPYVRSLAESSHAQVGCYACHLPGGAWSYPSFKAREWGPMLAGALTKRGVTGSSDGVATAACLRCHEPVMDGPLVGNGTRIDHAACTVSSDGCTSCHSTTAHGAATRWRRSPVMEECIRCHVTYKAPTECDTCHEGRRERDRLRRGPWQVTHGKTWRTTHGLGDLRYCGTCHPADYCVRCHGTPLPHGVDFGRTHGAAATSPGAKCADCHDTKTLCEDCHGMPMPHPAGYLPDHPKAVDRYGEKVCARCHLIAQDCEGCHAAHIHPATTEGTLGGPGGLIGVPNPGGVRR